MNRIKPFKMLKITTLLTASLSLSGCFTPTLSWTIRRDGILRRALSKDECAKLQKPEGCKEEFTINQFLDKVKEEEDAEFGIVLTPRAAKEITDELKRCNR